MPDAQPADKLHQLLRRVFGFESFRPNQEEIVRAILRRRDVVAILPTGSGKSLCYQFPARVRKGTAVVVSPLIALMKDQVDAAARTGIRAAFLNSAQTREEAADTYRALRRQQLDLLYISPERFALDGFAEKLAALNINLFAVDEAHCISEWGPEFRPDYLSLGRIKELFPDTPLAAFTATATLKAQKDIIARLGLKAPFILRASFDRPNLNYEVRPKEDLAAQLTQYIASRPGDCGIVYRTTRKHTEATARELRARGIKALPYHAGLDPEVRKKHQDLFMQGKAPVIVATIAFGMGIDKPDIRFVLHGDLPKNMESYYQETGRAGRDGLPSDCILFFGYGDIPRLEFLIRQAEDEKHIEIALEKLRFVKRYAERDICRRAAILAYFDEAYGEDNCGACDICRGGAPQRDATQDAALLLEAVKDTGERFGARFLIQALRGETLADDRIVKYGIHARPWFRGGARRSEAYWKRVLNALIGCGALVEEGEYRTLSIAKPGMQILAGNRQLLIRDSKPAPAPAPRTAKAAAPKPKPAHPAEPRNFDRELLEILRRVRAKLAERRGVPAFRICSDRALKYICAAPPRSLEDLAAIPGVGPATVDNYGRHLLRALEKYAAPAQPDPLEQTRRTPSKPPPKAAQPRAPQPGTAPQAKSAPAPPRKPAPAETPVREPKPEQTRAAALPQAPPPDPDALLKRELLKLRRDLAARDMRPLELVFIDSTIEQLAAKKPVTIEQFGKIYGVGAAKAKEYGPDAIEVIKKHLETTAEAPRAGQHRPAPPAQTRDPKKKQPVPKETPAPGGADQDAGLHERLADLRKRLAAEKHLRAYQVFDNKTLEALCRLLPRSTDDLLEVPGMGPQKTRHFGADILAVIAQALEEEEG